MLMYLIEAIGNTIYFMSMLIGGTLLMFFGLCLYACILALPIIFVVSIVKWVWNS